MTASERSTFEAFSQFVIAAMSRRKFSFSKPGVPAKYLSAEIVPPLEIALATFAAYARADGLSRNPWVIAERASKVSSLGPIPDIQP